MHNEHLDTDAPTNQKVVIKYAIGENCKFIA